jgi:hypothetical protein
MPETQIASVGYMGSVWLHNGTTLYELREVTAFGIPNRGEREQIETTHLKTPNWRRTYTSGFYEDADFEVTLNFRPRSDTDILLDDHQVDGDVRAMTIVLPENGVPTSMIQLTARCTNYERGEVGPDSLMTATATFRIVTMGAIVAYVAPV